MVPLLDRRANDRVISHVRFPDFVRNLSVINNKPILTERVLPPVNANRVHLSPPTLYMYKCTGLQFYLYTYRR